MKAKNGISKILVWILLALLMVGIAGFGTVNFSGSVQSVATVGDKDITVGDYARTLQSEMRAFEAQTGQPLTFQDAQFLGLQQRALAQLITGRALDVETDSLGLSVGDAELLKQIQNIQAFQGPDGSFNREAYRYALENIDISETAFEEQLREESARTLLQGAVLAGTALPDAYVNTLLAYALEQRNFTWAAVENEDVNTGIAEASEDDLKALYDENIAAYTHPEQRRITYAWLTPEMILDTVAVDEEAMRRAYDDRHDEFNQPERRLVERLIFPSDDAAIAAKARIDAAEATFEDEVAARGLDLLDVDLGDLAKDDLDGAAEGVFAAEVGDVVGPLPSDLGPALFRVNGILPEQSLPYIAASEMLRDELAADAARRAIDAQIEDLSDLLAAGATVEELAAESDMETGTITWSAADAEGIAAYEEFRDAAIAAQDGDFPEVLRLADGGIFAIRLDEVIAPAPIPFDEAREAVQADWDTRETQKAVMAHAEALAGQLNEGKTFDALGLMASTRETGIRRRGFVEALPTEVITAAFELETGRAVAVADAGRAILVRLDAVTPADLTADEALAMADALKDQAANDVAQDLFTAMATDIQSRVGIKIDQQALNAVHSNFQ
ncbi:peptidyl-prolyl cis-trans isomerase [Pseudoprimorskyibacter insulae]|uniref:Peptidyl-prolyl cis-trans isomerase D n=1 Tax=Pseudoprimorskyibacter insulae TaxID=1695997 RepID=A0A2R8AW80_9RHOB|nr:peptidyl-prolyl cis-trans isomerase [Pseudoprimorskyibacter insulae]SPF80129.1 Peptidyl-prolyl cis-trans isomerase D [Pseudoprimorskyibacter insulae]